MKRHTLSAEDAAVILFGWQLDDEFFDPERDQFQSGADVCQALAEHFGFTDDDYREISERRRQREHRRRTTHRPW